MLQRYTSVIWYSCRKWETGRLHRSAVLKSFFLSPQKQTTKTMRQLLRVVFFKSGVGERQQVNLGAGSPVATQLHYCCSDKEPIASLRSVSQSVALSGACWAHRLCYCCCCCCWRVTVSSDTSPRIDSATVGQNTNSMSVSRWESEEWATR